MAISTRDGLIAAIAGGPIQAVYKAAVASQTVGRYFSMWKSAGQPAAASVPASGGATAGVATTSATAGCIPLGTLSGSNVWYMAGTEMSGNVVGSLIIADRLVHHAFTGAVTGTTANTVGGTLPARAGNGDSVQIWLEIYGTMAATASAVTCLYTNQAGTGSRTATLQGGIPTSGAVGNMFGPFSLTAGDTGVQSVQSCTFATSVASGTWGITLVKRISAINIPSANSADRVGYSDISLPVLGTDPCLFYMGLATATTTANIIGSVALAQG